jgi:phosphohistidine phosphatase SixA
MVIACARRLQALAVRARLQALLCVLACASVSYAADTAPPLSGRALLDALRHGGYVLYFRHTSTDFGQSDEAMTSFDDCAKQRNLTEQGRAEARAIGEAIRRLEIPIGDVLASPFCRTRETAQLIFGRATVESAVRGGPADNANDRYAGLRKILSTPVAGNRNTAIASHGNPFRALTEAPYLAEGEVAVIEPLGARGFRIVARIPKDGWDSLARSASATSGAAAGERLFDAEADVAPRLAAAGTHLLRVVRPFAGQPG